MKQTIEKRLPGYCPPVAWTQVITQGNVLVVSGDVEETAQPSWEYGDNIDEW